MSFNKISGVTMRIAAISDIHTRSKGADDKLLDAIQRRVEGLAPDVFVIAGDISHRIDDLRDALSKLRINSCENLYVAGNHDVWFEEEIGLGTLEKYSKVVGEVCKEEGFSHLPDGPYVNEDIAFIGSMGWYDYSFKSEDLNIDDEHYEKKQFQGSYWRDYYCVDWGFSDKDATQLLNEKIQYDLNLLPESVNRVVFVSHHLPFQALTLYKNKLPWDFFSAFMGATSTGNVLQNDERVILSISGHSHIRNLLKREHMTAITVPLGYGRPPLEALDEFVLSAVAEIVIEGKNITVPGFVEGDICAGLPYHFEQD
ncbi:MAG: metallophosphoesterase [Candidatus Thorarchaeota archaeon]